ncbi:hypothetical protein V495_00995 [Pseudogymnoascus sp. VKM F-4514 (FW-929)]|nr:hypothetical protein V495_00995 [Pseudogymnoascus sp. VKM F-4514 (FW-929)]
MPPPTTTTSTTTPSIPTRTTTSKRPSTHDTMPPPAKKQRPSPATTTIPTPPPISVTPLLHESLTPTTHTLHTTQIISSTKMQTKISTLLSQLRSFSFAAPAASQKPVIVIAWAKAKAAGKLISVVEVVKREIAGEGGVWFQYNGLGEGISGVPRDKEDGGEEGDGEEDVEMEDVEEEGFEKMKTRIERAIEGTEKVRSVPVMTVYLSRVRIEALRGAYGEQTNSKR